MRGGESQEFSYQFRNFLKKITYSGAATTPTRRTGHAGRHEVIVNSCSWGSTAANYAIPAELDRDGRFGRQVCDKRMTSS
jgi:hypothetical protein